MVPSGSSTASAAPSVAGAVRPGTYGWIGEFAGRSAARVNEMKANLQE